MIIQSYGGGVQSVALLHMSLIGKIKKFDRVVFSDTMAEPKSVYEAVKRDQALCEKNGVPFDVVSYKDLSALDGNGVFVPAFTVNKETGKKGMMWRQCTQRFKINPIRRHLRKVGVKKSKLALGISTDEATRIKPSGVKWLTNVYPLIDLDISRADCEQFLNDHGIEAGKSACVFCPFRDAKQWQAIKDDSEEWAKAVDFDERLRDKRAAAGFDAFVHSSRKPLAELDDLSADDLSENECEGYCFI